MLYKVRGRAIRKNNIMKILAVISFIFLLFHVAKADEFLYKFGVDVGRVIYTGSGNIPLLKYESEVDIPVPDGVTVTYVEVTVNAISAPQVQYDALYHKVHIDYSWTQITLSSYKVLVKGI